MDKNGKKSNMELKTSTKPSTTKKYIFECSWTGCSFKDEKLSVVSWHTRQHIHERYSKKSTDSERTLEEYCLGL